MHSEPVGPLPLTAAELDPAAERRGDESWISAHWADERSLVAVFAGDRVAARSGSPEVAWVAAPGLAGACGDWAFLGLTGDGTALFAASVGENEPPPGGTEFRTVRELGLAAADSRHFGAVITALALLQWHRSHPRCPRCGGATRVTQAGWQRRCPADDSQHFPRVDPAVIMLVIDDADRALLGRQRRWPPRWFSTLAGFVEPGETLERAVAREVAEEVGVVVHDVHYLASQPWPFPSSLMLGFHAHAPQSELHPDGAEIAEARWLSRSELVAACSGGEIRLPPRLSISRWLIEQWYGAPLPGDWSRR